MILHFQDNNIYSTPCKFVYYLPEVNRPLKIYLFDHHRSKRIKKAIVSKKSLESQRILYLTKTISIK